MNREVIFAIAAVTVYVIWLIAFFLVIEPGLRFLTGQLFGVTINRELHKFAGSSSNTSLLEMLDAYSWRVNEPTSLSIRFGVGLLRFTFWLLAVTLPIVLAFILYFWIHR